MTAGKKDKYNTGLDGGAEAVALLAEGLAAALVTCPPSARLGFDVARAAFDRHEAFAAVAPPGPAPRRKWPCFSRLRERSSACI